MIRLKDGVGAAVGRPSGHGAGAHEGFRRGKCILKGGIRICTGGGGVDIQDGERRTGTFAAQ